VLTPTPFRSPKWDRKPVIGARIGLQIDHLSRKKSAPLCPDWYIPKTPCPKKPRIEHHIMPSRASQTRYGVTHFFTILQYVFSKKRSLNASVILIKNRPFAKITIILRLYENEPDLASVWRCMTPIGTRNGLRLVQVMKGGFEGGSDNRDSCSGHQRYFPGENHITSPDRSFLKAVLCATRSSKAACTDCTRKT